MIDKLQSYLVQWFVPVLAVYQTFYVVQDVFIHVWKIVLFCWFLGSSNCLTKARSFFQETGGKSFGKDLLKNISKKTLYQGHGKPGAFLPMNLLTLYFQHKYNTFANDSIAHIKQSLSHLIDSLSHLIDSLSHLIDSFSVFVNDSLKNTNDLLIGSLIVCCIDALYWWSGGAPWPLRCGSLVHWLTCCAAPLLRLPAWAAESMRRGGTESLIYCCSSLTHTPTDSQIQFNRLFDDSFDPVIHRSVCTHRFTNSI